MYKALHMQIGIVTLDVVDETPEILLNYEKGEVLSLTQAEEVYKSLEMILNFRRKLYGVDK